MNVGHNTASGKALAQYVERVEVIRAEKKLLSDDESAVMAEAKAAGFIPKAIKHVVKLRAMKPQDRQEAEQVVDTYLHALGMAPDTPLFRQIGAMSVDIASREQVTEALKRLVPENGSITVEVGGKSVRLTRDKSGEVTASDVLEAPPPAFGGGAIPGPSPRGRDAEPVPDVDEAGAELLGRDAFKANEPIISNPFPFGDDRRGRWDFGWRAESGTDGMGPPED